MQLYLDTSALVKLVVDEHESSALEVKSRDVVYEVVV
jgi:predicted nucleic acid-binding protein